MMGLCFIGLFLKFIYNTFLKGIHTRLKYRDADIATLSNVGILNPDEMKKDLIDQFFYFEENIKISKNENLKSIADEKLIYIYMKNALID